MNEFDLKMETLAKAIVGTEKSILEGGNTKKEALDGMLRKYVKMLDSIIDDFDEATYWRVRLEKLRVAKGVSPRGIG